MTPDLDRSATGVRYHIVRDTDYYRTSTRHMAAYPSRRPSRILRWVLRPLGVAVLLAYVADYAYARSFSASAHTLPLASLIWFAVLYLIVCWPVLFVRLFSRFIARAHEKSGDSDRELDVDLRPAGVELSLRLTRIEAAWAAYCGARILEGGILLQVLPKGGLWLPDSCLVEGAAEEARAIVRRAVPGTIDIDRAMS